MGHNLPEVDYIKLKEFSIETLRIVTHTDRGKVGHSMQKGKEAIQRVAW